MTIRLKPEVVVITLTNLHHEVGHDRNRPERRAGTSFSAVDSGDPRS